VKKYDAIVVGSGISGLTLAMLLGLNGRSVLIVEKSPLLGGSLTRFYRQGIPFDTGFHFTGGFQKNGILHDMLTVLGLYDDIRPVYLTHEKSNRHVFAMEQVEYSLPSGYQETTDRVKQYFPREERAIERYFTMVRQVCKQTVAMDLRRISLVPNVLKEDYVSLDEVLSALTDDNSLKGLLSVFGMCYGVRPKEISFANHSRVCCGLYESVVRVKDGGDAFIRAFRSRFEDLDIDIMLKTYIADCVATHNKQVGWVVLNDGQEVSADHFIFSIHPQEILKVLPRDCLHKAFVDRVNGFESSAGFFSLYGVVESTGQPDSSCPSILSLFPSANVDQFMDPAYSGVLPMVIMRNYEDVRGEACLVLIALELSFPEHVKRWKDSRSGSRSSSYSEYKQQCIERIKERVITAYPEYKYIFRVVEAASILTFRDYLHSPDGSAYGIKQKIGQFNLFGKLPLRNVYAAGQSSMLPGLVGAMMSSFIVARSIIGKEDYSAFIEQRLGS
jgi:all-trans-retinol 13,14-reductase